MSKLYYSNVKTIVNKQVYIWERHMFSLYEFYKLYTEICCGVEIETKVMYLLHGYRYNCLDV